eukprot:TRINITY_DN9067_c0_g1_i1.p1 TRINITY_DN9067_c0_g1~~TRINITY_DN9067_c0_g1_i1.p1  ORF type:complete len:1071 (-),score=217.98 TRINITY_DN9067_c0_g1_i1:27-3239(-)
MPALSPDAVLQRSESKHPHMFMDVSGCLKQLIFVFILAVGCKAQHDTSTGSSSSGTTGSTSTGTCFSGTTSTGPTGLTSTAGPWKPFPSYSIVGNRATKANVGDQWDTMLLSANTVPGGFGNATTWAVTLDSITDGQVFIGVAPAGTSQSPPNAMNNGWYLDCGSMRLSINWSSAPANVPLSAVRLSPWEPQQAVASPISVSPRSTVWVQLGPVDGTNRSLSFAVDGVNMGTQMWIDKRLALALAVLLRFPGDSVSLMQLIDSLWKPHPAFNVDGASLSKRVGTGWDAIAMGADLLSPGVHTYELRIDCVRFTEAYVGLVPSNLEPFTSNGWLYSWFVQLNGTTVRLRNDSSIREPFQFVSSCINGTLVRTPVTLRSGAPSGVELRITVVVDAVWGASMAVVADGVDLGIVYEGLPVQPALSLGVLLESPGDTVTITGRKVGAGQPSSSWSGARTDWTMLSGGTVQPASACADPLGCREHNGVVYAGIGRPGHPGEQWHAASCAFRGGLLTFGGWGYDMTGAHGLMNALWHFSNGQWTWLSGSSSVNPVTFDEDRNAPKAVQRATMVASDATGMVYVFGGYFRDVQAFSADFWSFNTTSSLWTQHSGAASVQSRGLGNDSSGACLGERHSTSMAIDANGHVIVFGGYQGNTSTPVGNIWRWSLETGFVYLGEMPFFSKNGRLLGRAGSMMTVISGNRLVISGGVTKFNRLEWYLNDVWIFDLETNNFTLISGSDVRSQNGVGGVYRAVGGRPGGRAGAAIFAYGDMFAWYGGYGFGTEVDVVGDLNDVWAFDLATRVWTLVSGSSMHNQDSVFDRKPLAPGGRSFMAYAARPDGTLLVYDGVRQLENWSPADGDRRVCRRWNHGDLWLLDIGLGNTSVRPVIFTATKSVQIVCAASSATAAGVTAEPSATTLQLSSPTDKGPGGPSDVNLAHFIVAGLACFLICAGAVAFLAVRWRRRNRSDAMMLGAESQSLGPLTSSVFGHTWEVSSAEVVVGARIGQGAHGAVYKATCRGYTCVVNRPGQEDSGSMASFRRECPRLNSFTPHPTVVPTYGVCVRPAGECETTMLEPL